MLKHRLKSLSKWKTAVKNKMKKKTFSLGALIIVLFSCNQMSTKLNFPDLLSPLNSPIYFATFEHKSSQIENSENSSFEVTVDINQLIDNYEIMFEINYLTKSYSVLNISTLIDKPLKTSSIMQNEIIQKWHNNNSENEIASIDITAMVSIVNFLLEILNSNYSLKVNEKNYLRNGIEGRYSVDLDNQKENILVKEIFVADKSKYTSAMSYKINKNTFDEPKPESEINQINEILNQIDYTLTIENTMIVDTISASVVEAEKEIYQETIIKNRPNQTNKTIMKLKQIE